jgi:cell division protein FtsB
VEDDDNQARRERADRLRAEIDALKSGNEGPPDSPHEFVERRAREQRELPSEEPERDSPGHGGAAA